MLTSKQRASLRKLANPLDTIFQIGKEGIGENLILQVGAALNTRELIKLRVLETAGITPREACDTLALELKAEAVQVIGTRFVLYRMNPKAPKIVLE